MTNSSESSPETTLSTNWILPASQAFVLFAVVEKERPKTKPALGKYVQAYLQKNGSITVYGRPFRSKEGSEGNLYLGLVRKDAVPQAAQLAKKSLHVARFLNTPAFLRRTVPGEPVHRIRRVGKGPIPNQPASLPASSSIGELADALLSEVHVEPVWMAPAWTFFQLPVTFMGAMAWNAMAQRVGEMITNSNQDEG